MAKKTLIQCGWLVSVDPEIGDLKGAELLVEGDRIAAVGENLNAQADEVIDASNLIVMPGLVNSHLHLWQTGMRAMGSEWVSPQYHKHMHSNIATKYTPEDTYLADLVGCLNLIDGGTTTVLDWCHNIRDLEMAERALDGLEESQIRAVFAHGTAKPPTAPGETPYTHVPHPRERVEYLRNNRMTGNDRLVTLAMAILGPDYGAYEVAVADLKLSRELDLLTTAHAWNGYNQSLPEAEQIKDSYIRLADLGLLGPGHNITHGNYMPEDQVERIIGEGVSVTSTVLCECHGHGAGPLTGKVRAMGSTPSLGTDTVTLVAEDMFGEMRAALYELRYQISRAARASGDYPLKAMPVDNREALQWATIGGARALRMEDRIGSLTPGKKADIVMLRAGDANLFPVHDPVYAITEQATGANVEHVLIDGEFRKRDGVLAFPADKREALKTRLAQSADRLMTEAGYRPHAA